jgi:hypothetical protein
MKKIILLFALGLLFAGSVSAQSYYYGPRRHVVRRSQRRRDDDFYRVKVGITGGVNFADQVSSYNSDYTTGSITGFNAGLYLDVPLIYPLSFEPEVLYSQKGYTLNESGDHFSSRQDFIDVPLLAKFHLAPGFNFLIGPQFSFLTQTVNTTSAGFTLINQNYANPYNGANTFVDGVVGVSFDLNPSVELRARYTLDFNQTRYGESVTPEYRNQVFQIGLGINFGGR